MRALTYANARRSLRDDVHARNSSVLTISIRCAHYTIFPPRESPRLAAFSAAARATSRNFSVAAIVEKWETLMAGLYSD